MDWRGILLVTISLVLATQDGRGGDDIQTARKRMVKEIELDVMTTSLYIGRPQLTEEVMAVMAKVPRHEFVPNENQGAAYLNCPLPLELPPRSTWRRFVPFAAPVPSILTGYRISPQLKLTGSTFWIARISTKPPRRSGRGASASSPASST